METTSTKFDTEHFVSHNVFPICCLIAKGTFSEASSKQRATFAKGEHTSFMVALFAGLIMGQCDSCWNLLMSLIVSIDSMFCRMVVQLSQL